MNEKDLEYYADLKNNDDKSKGIFIGEGRYVIERMIQSGCDILSILCTPGYAEFFKKLSGDKIQLLVMQESEIKAITGFNFHRGALAAAVRRQFPYPEEMIKTSDGKMDKTLVICPSITDPKNLGAIIRTSAALGLDGILLGIKSADPLSRISIRCSMGNVFSIPMAYFDDDRQMADVLKKFNFNIAGTVLHHEKSVSINEYKRKPLEAIVFGHEDEGISGKWQSFCDQFLTIPMQNRADSLNVSVAAGIILWKLTNN